MIIHIKIFAALKSYFQEDFEIQLSDKSSIIDVIQHLEKLNPKATHILSHSLVALDDEMIDRNAYLKPDQTVCILPPVSGG